ncbi:sensor histidine kinase [Pseudomonas sp. DWP1b1]|uniref:sensor histidine kinase n=1 Tax=unclassified Pseudomonas TaxID=196821 RepID=UPI003CEE4CA1
MDTTPHLMGQSPLWQRLLSAQREALEMAIARKSLDELLGFLARAGSEHLGGRSAVFLVDQNRETLLYGASSGLDAGYITAIHGFEIGPHSPSCGTAAYTGDLVIVGDVASDQLWAPFLALANQHGIAACWSKPLKDANGVVLGTYAIYHNAPRLPSDDDLEAIELLAHTAALMIERSVADATLQKTLDALQRSELATRELSHRVMNTFHVFEGLLSAKVRSLLDPEARAATAEALERIRAMSLVHRKLFALTQHSAVDLDASGFLDDLVNELARAFAGDKNLRLIMSKEVGITLSAERCASLGLLAVELVLNAIKHAFEDGQAGIITVTLHRDVESVVFSVRDNGKGLPEGTLVGKHKRLGTRLIHSFVADLKADLQVQNLAKGAEFSVRFPCSA